MTTPDEWPEPPPRFRPGAVGRGPLLWVAVALLAGYIFAAAGPAVAPRVLAVAALPFAAAAAGLAGRAPREGFYRTKSFAQFAACLLAGATPLAWAWSLLRAPPAPAAWETLPPREATLTLRVERAFATPPDGASADGLARVVAAPAVLPELPGRLVYYRVLASDFLQPPARGAVFPVIGLLAYPPPAAPDDAATAKDTSGAGFDRYLRDEGAWFSFTRGRLHGPVTDPAGWDRWLTAQNARLEEILRAGPAGLETDYGSIYVAMLLGKTSALDPAQRAAFTQMGVMYFFAISGLHVGIVGGVLWWACRRVPRLPRVVGDLLTLTLLWLYIEITGGSASAQRVGLMLTFYLVTQWFQRPRGPLPAALAAGVATLLAQPLALRDAGFQLSYAVVLGIILYCHPLLDFLRQRLALWPATPREGLPPWRRGILWLHGRCLALLAVSWTAQLCSLPLVAEFFGVVSAGGLLLNFVLWPALVVVLGAGVAAGLAGLPGVAPFTWLAWLANAVGLCGTGFMRWMVGWSVPLPGIHAAVRVRPEWAAPLATLAVLAVMLAGRPRATAPRRLYFALPVLVLIIFAASALRPA